MPTPENIPHIPEKENIPEGVGGNRETPQNLSEFTNQLIVNMASNVNNKFRELKKIDSTGENKDTKKEMIGYQLQAAEGAALLGREYDNLSQENFRNEQKFRKTIGDIIEIKLIREDEGTPNEENTVTLTTGQGSFFVEGEFGSKLKELDTVTCGYTYTGDSLKISVQGSQDSEQFVPGLEINSGNLSASVNIPLEDGVLSIQDYEMTVGYKLLKGVEVKVKQKPGEIFAGVKFSFKYR